MTQRRAKVNWPVIPWTTARPREMVLSLVSASEREISGHRLDGVAPRLLIRRPVGEHNSEAADDALHEHRKAGSEREQGGQAVEPPAFTSGALGADPRGQRVQEETEGSDTRERAEEAVGVLVELAAGHRRDGVEEHVGGVGVGPVRNGEPGLIGGRQAPGEEDGDDGERGDPSKSGDPAVVTAVVYLRLLRWGENAAPEHRSENADRDSYREVSGDHDPGVGPDRLVGLHADGLGED